MRRGFGVAAACLSLVVAMAGTGAAAVAPAAAVATRMPVWTSTYAPSGTQVLGHPGLAVGGRRLFVGTSYFLSGTYPAVGGILTMAYDQRTGHRLWARKVLGPNVFGATTARSIVATPSGSMVFVTALAEGDTEDVLIVAYDGATGAERWRATFDSTFQGASTDDGPGGLAVSADGARLFVGVASMRTWVVAYDAASGSRLWARSFGPTPSTVFRTLTVNSAGTRVYAVGSSLLALKASTGATAWSRSLPTAGGMREADLVEVSRDGSRVIVTGDTCTVELCTTATADMVTEAYDASGQVLWSRTYATAGVGDFPRALVVAPGGYTAYVLTGPGAPGVIAYVLGTGATRWTAPLANAFYEGMALAPDGARLYVVGGNQYSPNEHLDTAAYNTNGGLLWTAAVPAAHLTWSPSPGVAVDPTSSLVFVSSMTQDSSGRWLSLVVAYPA